MGSVPFPNGIIRVAVVVGGINPMDIIHPTVVVIVDGVVGNLVLIHPHLIGQIEVGVPDTRINNRHDDLLVAGRDVPRLVGIDVGVVHAAVLPVVEQAPQPAVLKRGITRRRIKGDGPVRLDVEKPAAGLQLSDAALQLPGDLARLAKRGGGALNQHHARHEPVLALDRVSFRRQALGHEPGLGGILQPGQDVGRVDIHAAHLHHLRPGVPRLAKLGGLKLPAQRQRQQSRPKVDPTFRHSYQIHSGTRGSILFTFIEPTARGTYSTNTTR